MNINEEGKYYASMVRKFRTVYKSKNLHGFCKEQKISYTKMLHQAVVDVEQNNKATVFGYRVGDSERYGVAEF